MSDADLHPQLEHRVVRLEAAVVSMSEDFKAMAHDIRTLTKEVTEIRAGMSRDMAHLGEDVRMLRTILIGDGKPGDGLVAQVQLANQVIAWGKRLGWLVAAEGLGLLVLLWQSLFSGASP